jgi:Uma2 family endonuclease
MAIDTHVNEETYQRIVLSDPIHKWELYDGRLREKPGMTWDHGRVAALLSHLLQLQLEPNQFQVAINDWRLRRSPDTVYIPDIVVVPVAFGQELAGRPGVLAIFSQPLPLVIEIWSASTGDYDVDTKIPAYQRRGDLEIWRIHPYERTLTAWRVQSEGSYEQTIYREGSVRPAALANVAVDLAALFGR